MGNDEQITDLVPPVAPLINTAGAVNVVAGALLLVYSELIHNIIGVVLIIFGLYLFYRARQIPSAVARILEKARVSQAGSEGSKSGVPREAG